MKNECIMSSDKKMKSWEILSLIAVSVFTLNPLIGLATENPGLAWYYWIYYLAQVALCAGALLLTLRKKKYFEICLSVPFIIHCSSSMISAMRTTMNFVDYGGSLSFIADRWMGCVPYFLMSICILVGFQLNDNILKCIATIYMVNRILCISPNLWYFISGNYIWARWDDLVLICISLLVYCLVFVALILHTDYESMVFRTRQFVKKHFRFHSNESVTLN